MEPLKGETMRNQDCWVAGGIPSAALLMLLMVLSSVARADTVCVPGTQGPEVGIVVALSGDVFAESEDCGVRARRPLGCGAVVYGGDRLIAGAGSAVAFEMQQTRVQVAADSELRVAVDASDAPDLALLRGRVRVVDPDAVGEPGRRLATADLVSTGRGDTEAIAIAGERSTICEYARPLVLTPIGGGARHTLAPGACSGANFAALDAASVGVSLLDAERCELADNRFDPIDVASAPASGSFPSPVPPPPPPPTCQAGTCDPPPPPPPPPFCCDVIESPGVNEPPPL
jgi:hypothetical protein